MKSALPIFLSCLGVKLKNDCKAHRQHLLGSVAAAKIGETQ
jgi:hypothetical protein